MARLASTASNREMIIRLEQSQAAAEKRWQEFRQDSEQRRLEFQDFMRDAERRRIEDRQLLLDTMREMKQDSQAREQRIESSFQSLSVRFDSLSVRFDSLRWWVLGVGVSVIAAIAAIVIGAR